MTWVRDYFDGYRALMPHPFSPSTGSEGRCDICGGQGRSREHDEPWTRVEHQYEWEDPPLAAPSDPYAGVVFGDSPGFPV